MRQYYYKQDVLFCYVTSSHFLGLVQRSVLIISKGTECVTDLD